MPAPQLRRSFADHFLESAILGSAAVLEHAPPLRKAAFQYLGRRLSARPVNPRDEPGVAADKRALGLALLSVAERSLAEHRLGRRAQRGLLKVLFHDQFVRRGDPACERSHRERFGVGPPDFLVISPGRACNLRCTGCYANSADHPERLSWDTADRLVSQARDLWGTRFFVISGGEPFAWREAGRGVLDLAEAHPECFFILYTNGTLVDAATTRRLARLGNLSPGFSVEGLREETDARRGAGVFEQVLTAMERLRGEGVLFGLSLTATRHNADRVLSDEVVELFFGQLGVAYAWVFHYMPIGRAFTLDLMTTPQQRVALWRRVQHLIHDRHLFVADFWNGASVTNGCIAAGRPGGYFHVDWNGNLSPCVFVPYAPVNVNELFARGGTLDDAWQHPFFAAIRAWQREAGYREPGEPHDGSSNWLAPCPMRDRHAQMLKLLREHAPPPNDADAAAALADPAYHEGLERFGSELDALTAPLWKEHAKGN
jgi:MoaA/NifB/PqqE/SkfB family radical SAM enzyme